MRGHMEGVKNRIKVVLGVATEALAVETIRMRLGRGNWSTILANCLELHVNGEIHALKTSNGWVFWI